MNEIQKLDRFALQRLIDGELDEESRIQFLRNCDEHFAHWRTVALAFVEDQVLRQTVQSERASMPSVSVRVSEPEPSRVQLQPSQWNEERNLGRWKNLFATVASIALLIIGFWIGGHFGSSNRLGSSNDGPPVHGMASTVPATITEPVPSKSEDSREELKRAGTLQFVGLSDQQGSLTEIPVFSFPQIENRLLGHSVEELKQIESKLRRYGLSLDYRIEMLEGQLPDGRRVVVPVKNVGLRTYGQ